MSVKFEKETVRTSNVSGLKDSLKDGLKGGKEDTLHKIGEAVTGGKSQTGYLAVLNFRCDLFDSAPHADRLY